MSRLLRWSAVAVLGLMVASPVYNPASAFAQDTQITRKVKVKVSPEYPDLARRLNISGIVKVEIVIAPNGTVKSTKVIGGHPLLVDAAVDAVKKWRFEPAAEETTGIIDFKFQPE